MSKFISDVADYDDQSSTRIDFEKATLLKGGGSTCDIYKTRWQRRTVFVKRLKKEYRNSPLYLDALEKEYEIGVGLNHPSLPTYLAFSRDFIVMDFIDGMTLADMIKAEDPWLKEERNRKRALSQLIESVEYLHRHNVVHCDIKADNIMITANGNNLVLLDFDKCYTDYFNDTSGHPGKYELDVDNPGRMAMDWRGIANIAEDLKPFGGFGGRKKHGKLIDACFRDEVNPEDLKRLIEDNSRSYGRIFLLLALISMTTVILGYVFLWKSTGSDQSNDIAETSQFEPIEFPAEEKEGESDYQKTDTKEENSVNPEPLSANPAQLKSDAKNKAAILDPLIEPYFSKLKTRLANIAALKNKGGVSKEQLIDSLRAFSNMEDEYITESFAILQETFPDVSDREAWRIMINTNSYPSYKRWAEPLQRTLTEPDSVN